jgi:acetyl-CoA carboxylase biotin carboxyl carrier protein
MQISESFVLKIIEKFSAGKIGELELDDGTSRLVLKKTSAQAPYTQAFQAGGEVPSGGAAPSARAAAAASSGGAAQAADSSPDTGAVPNSAVPNSAAQNSAAQNSATGGTSNADVITSPIVGTFYPALSPDAPPLVRPGSKVKAGDTLCILEAMKMMNHLVAEFDCEILAVKAASGDLVEYGQALFEVKRL